AKGSSSKLSNYQTQNAAATSRTVSHSGMVNTTSADTNAILHGRADVNRPAKKTTRSRRY
ncbi:hypothetical protein, partial [Escherichia coli]|uniref:hypothetical protein n=1 Tax=Escherichia coli TaxID=562 RepID=UPI003F21C2D9